MEQELLADQAKKVLRGFLGASANCQITPILTGKFNTSFLATCGPEKFVIRIAPPDDAGFIFYEKKMMAQEPEIHQIVLEKTSIPVPKILLYDDTRALIDRDYIIMEYFKGIPLSDFYSSRAVQSKVLFTVGEWLSRAHVLTRESYGYLGAHNFQAYTGSPRHGFTRSFPGFINDDPGNLDLFFPGVLFPQFHLAYHRDS